MGRVRAGGDVVCCVDAAAVVAFRCCFSRATADEGMLVGDAGGVLTSASVRGFVGLVSFAFLFWGDCPLS